MIRKHMNEVIYVFIIEMIPWPSQFKFIPSVTNYKQDVFFYLEDMMNIQNIRGLPNETFMN